MLLAWSNMRRVGCSRGRLCYTLQSAAYRHPKKGSPMPYAIRIHENGGPEKLKWDEVEVGDPGPGEVRVRNTAVGLNFIDTYHRSGLYPMQLPLTLGGEGAGVVEAVGPKVKDLKAGDRVTYVGPLGAYSEVLLRPADRLVKVPAGIED